MTGEVRHACTAYLTFVHLGPDIAAAVPAVRPGDAGRAAALARSPGAARAPAGAGEAAPNTETHSNTETQLRTSLNKRR